MNKIHNISPRAKRVLYPAGAVTILVFLSFIAHIFILGTSSFPDGRIQDGKYLVEEHGRVIELTAAQWWSSYVHGIVAVTIFATFAALVLVFYWRGDLRDEYRNP